MFQSPFFVTTDEFFHFDNKMCVVYITAIMLCKYDQIHVSTSQATTQEKRSYVPANQTSFFMFYPHTRRTLFNLPVYFCSTDIETAVAWICKSESAI